MIKKVITISILFFAVHAVASQAQHAQTTMRVSVMVVSASTVETIQPDILSVDSENNFILGMLTMTGIKSGNVILNNSSEITLRDKKGEEIRMNVLSLREKDTVGSEYIRYKGIYAGKNPVGFYGELTTSIEYL